jgi:hypothetical protein
VFLVDRKLETAQYFKLDTDKKHIPGSPHFAPRLFDGESI